MDVTQLLTCQTIYTPVDDRLSILVSRVMMGGAGDVVYVECTELPMRLVTFLFDECDIQDCVHREGSKSISLGGGLFGESAEVDIPSHRALRARTWTARRPQRRCSALPTR